MDAGVLVEGGDIHIGYVIGIICVFEGGIYFFPKIVTGASLCIVTLEFF